MQQGLRGHGGNTPPPYTRPVLSPGAPTPPPRIEGERNFHRQVLNLVRERLEDHTVRAKVVRALSKRNFVDEQDLRKSLIAYYKSEVEEILKPAIGWFGWKNNGLRDLRINLDRRISIPSPKIFIDEFVKANFGDPNGQVTLGSADKPAFEQLVDDQARIIMKHNQDASYIPGVGRIGLNRIQPASNREFSRYDTERSLPEANKLPPVVFTDTDNNDNPLNGTLLSRINPDPLSEADRAIYERQIGATRGDAMERRFLTADASMNKMAQERRGRLSKLGRWFVGPENRKRLFRGSVSFGVGAAAAMAVTTFATGGVVLFGLMGAVGARRFATAATAAAFAYKDAREKPEVTWRKAARKAAGRFALVGSIGLVMGEMVMNRGGVVDKAVRSGLGTAADYTVKPAGKFVGNNILTPIAEKVSPGSSTIIYNDAANLFNDTASGVSRGIGKLQEIGGTAYDATRGLHFWADPTLAENAEKASRIATNLQANQDTLKTNLDVLKNQTDVLERDVHIKNNELEAGKRHLTKLRSDLPANATTEQLADVTNAERKIKELERAKISAEAAKENNSKDRETAKERLALNKTELDKANKNAKEALDLARGTETPSFRPLGDSYDHPQKSEGLSPQRERLEQGPNALIPNPEVAELRAQLDRLNLHIGNLAGISYKNGLLIEGLSEELARLKELLNKADGRNGDAISGLENKLRDLENYTKNFERQLENLNNSRIRGGGGGGVEPVLPERRGHGLPFTEESRSSSPYEAGKKFTPLDVTVKGGIVHIPEIKNSQSVLNALLSKSQGSGNYFMDIPNSPKGVAKMLENLEGNMLERAKGDSDFRKLAAEFFGIKDFNKEALTKIKTHNFSLSKFNEVMSSLGYESRTPSYNGPRFTPFQEIPVSPRPFGIPIPPENNAGVSSRVDA